MPTAGSRTRRALLAAALCLAGIGGVGAVGVQAAAPQQADDCTGRRWLTAWTTAPQDSAGRFTDQTLRSVVAATASGTAVRVTLSNRFGSAPVTFDDVHVGRSAGGADVDPDTVSEVTFRRGDTSVTVEPGEEVVSDGVALEVAAGDDLAVSYHVAGGPVALDRHLQAMATSYATPAGAGRHGGDAGGEAFTAELTSWFGLVAVDVRAPRSVGAVAVLGDSLTEGVGSTPDADRAWPSVVAARLDGRAAVLNAGIGGNHAARAVVLQGPNGPQDFGPAAVERLDADVLSRAGVTDLVVYLGINDVFTQIDAPDVVRAVTRSYRRIVREAHREGIRVIGATLTPATQGGVKEADRAAVNQWIRTSGVFDAVVDFERAVADPADVSKLQPAFDKDRVHLTDAGYAALASAFDESLLRGTGCTA